MRLAPDSFVLSLALLTFAASCATPASPISDAQAHEAQRPVVVELFSSEGCSSCPPADIVLRDLARHREQGQAEIIAIEAHVDYWNGLGWADPFSSPAWSARQRVYSAAMGNRSVYTPQAVIDGRADRLGSDREGVLEAIAEAAKRPKARIALSREQATIRVSISSLPSPHAEAQVLLGMTEEGLATAVLRGENAGATVVHGPVLRSLEVIGQIGAGDTSFVGAKSVAPPSAWKKDKLHVVVIVQAKEKREIIGAAALPWG